VALGHAVPSEQHRCPGRPQGNPRRSRRAGGRGRQEPFMKTIGFLQSCAPCTGR
jgi:hypothetical protein